MSRCPHSVTDATNGDAYDCTLPGGHAGRCKFDTNPCGREALVEALSAERAEVARLRGLAEPFESLEEKFASMTAAWEGRNADARAAEAVVASLRSDLAAALARAEELAKLAGSAIVLATLDTRAGEATAEEPTHALTSAVWGLVKERDAALARAEEAEARFAKERADHINDVACGERRLMRCEAERDAEAQERIRVARDLSDRVAAALDAQAAALARAEEADAASLRACQGWTRAVGWAKRWKAEAHHLRASLVGTFAAIEKTTEELKARATEPNAKPLEVCGWCGAFSPLTVDDLKSHILGCEKNPLVARALAAESALSASRAEVERMREALRLVRDFPVPEQDNMVAANMREVARAALASAPASREEK